MKQVYFNIVYVLCCFVCLCGCQTAVIEKKPPFRPTVEQFSLLTPEPNRYYASITVKEHSFFRDKLVSWENSAYLLEASFDKWLAIESLGHLKDPTLNQLQSFIETKLKQSLKSNGVLVLYLGTHHEKDGMLIFKDDAVQADVLLKQLDSLPGELLLIADVCYAGKWQALQKRLTSTQFIFACRDDQLATEYLYHHESPKIKAETFPAINQTQYLLPSPQPSRYSILGFLLYQSLYQIVTSTPQNVNTQEWLTGAVNLNQSLGPYFPIRKMPYCYQPSSNKNINLAYEDNSMVKWAENVPKDSLSQFETLKKLMNKVQDPNYYLKTQLLINSLATPNEDVPSLLKQIKYLESEVYWQKRKTQNTWSQVIADTLYKRHDFVHGEKAYERDFLFFDLLKDKRGRCAATSALYLILSEQIEPLPMLYGICMPGHILVGTKDGKMMIETTMEGITITNEILRQTRPFKPTPQAARFYLHPLSKQQTTATYYAPLATLLHKQGDLKTALKVAQLAIRYLPNDPISWNALGQLQAVNKQKKMAIYSYNRALKINPDMPDVLNNLANITSDYHQKVKLYWQAIALNPNIEEIWKNLSVLAQKNKDIELLQKIELERTRIGLK